MPAPSEPDREAALAAVAAPVRRALLALVARSPSPVGRDEAAVALGIPRATAAAALDRLVQAGLLTVEHRRMNGRSGPGAGRPAKLYSRSTAEVAVHVPERRYDLAAELLLEAAEAVEADGGTVPTLLPALARRRGRELGAASETLAAALEATGYAPRSEDGRTRLANCPFARLSRAHAGTVCPMNLALVQGVAEATGIEPSRLRFVPGTDGCCVEVVPSPGDGSGIPAVAD